MNPFFWGLILGLFLGTNIGLFLFAILKAGSDADERMGEF